MGMESNIFKRFIFNLTILFFFLFILFQFKKKNLNCVFEKYKFEINHHILGNSEKWILISQIFYRDNNKK